MLNAPERLRLLPKRTEAPSPILICLSDFPFLPLRPMVVQTTPLTTHPLLQNKRRVLALVQWLQLLLGSILHAEGGAIILASFLWAEEKVRILPTALLSPAPRVCSASGGSLSSAVFFLLNQSRRN